MSPTPPEQMTQPVTGTPKESVFAPLHKVTPLSKIIAAVVFITLPFVGFGMGYVYAPSVIMNTSIDIPQLDSSVPPVVAPSTSVLRFITMKSDSYDLLSQDSEMEVITHVRPATSAIETLLFSIPYFKQVASTSEFMVFTVYGLKGERANGLYKYDRATKEFFEMKTSALYDSWYSRVATSPDNKAIAVVGGADNHLELGRSVVLIDLAKDATTTIVSLATTDNARFIGWCGAGCDEGQIEWIDDLHIKVMKFEIMCADTTDNKCIFSEPILSQQMNTFDVIR